MITAVHTTGDCVAVNPAWFDSRCDMLAIAQEGVKAELEAILILALDSFQSLVAELA